MNNTSTSAGAAQQTPTTTPTSSSIIASTSAAVTNSSTASAPTFTSASASASSSQESIANSSPSTSASTETPTSSAIPTTSIVVTTSSSIPQSTSVQTTPTSTAAGSGPTSTAVSSIATSSSASQTSTAKSTTASASASLVVHTSVSTVASSDGHPATTIVVTVTSLQTEAAPSASTSSTRSAGLAGSTSVGDSSTTSSGVSTGGKTAIAVIIPIAAVAALIAAGLWFWRRRRANKDAEDLRRKEVEEYGYNPNDDPTLPAVGGIPHDGPFEMVQDQNAGYRGWGTTAAGSSNRKASTNVSGGAGQGLGGSHAYSDSTSPTLGNPAGDTPLMGGSPTYHPLDEGGEILGTMGPAKDNNHNGEVHRGPSNASSSYSAANRSDGSGEASAPGGATGQFNNYYNDYAAGGNGGGPYNDGGGYGNGNGMGGGGGVPQPIIRDVQAKRNTRIEHPSHFPQQGGISQNF